MNEVKRLLFEYFWIYNVYNVLKDSSITLNSVILFLFGSYVP